jgi:amidohydrolase family protein/complex I intermediate-associated protein 30 (CIA30)
MDLHVHLGSTGGSRMMAAEQAPDMVRKHLRSYLNCGVTTVRSLADDTDVVLSLRDATPRVLAAGPAFTAVGGHPVRIFSWDEGLLRRGVRQVSDPAQVGPWIAELKAMGVHVIKAVYDGGGGMPKLSKEALAEVIRQAHGHGLPCVVHVGSRQDALEALDLGANGIEHVPGGMDAEVIAKLREKDAVWVPTLAVIWQYAAAREEIARYLARPEVRRSIPRVVHFSASRAPAWPVPASLKTLFENGMVNVAAAYRAGVRVATGSDAGNPNVFHGPGVLREIELFVEAGLTPVEAIHCATGIAGRNAGLTGAGVIEPGRRADLVIVRGDASKDVRALYDVEAVIADGRVVDRAATSFDAEYAMPDRATEPAFGRWWSVYTDRVMGGRSQATAEKGDPWRFKGEVVAGTYRFATLSLELSETGFQTFDAGGRRGLRFEMRGTGGAFTVEIGSAPVRDFDLHTAIVAAPGAEWRAVEVPFDSLRQRAFGKSAPFDRSQLLTVRLSAVAPGPFDVEVRGFEFYR